MCRGWNCGEGPLLAWRDTELATERRERDADARQELRAAVREVRDAQRRVGKVVGEKPETGDAGGPAPVRGSEVEQLDLQAVTRLGVLHGDRPVDLVDAREVEDRQVLDRGARPDLAAGGVQRIELDDLGAPDRGDWDEWGSGGGDASRLWRRLPGR